MEYEYLCGNKISKLGFGTSRLPKLNDRLNETIVNAMIDKAIKGLVNFFSLSSIGIRKIDLGIISKYLQANYNGAYYLLNQYSLFENICDPISYLNLQLMNCNVNYFDYYMLYDICEDMSRIDILCSKMQNLMNTFNIARKLGKIKHFGFSCSGSVKVMNWFLEGYGDIVEFCQIPINYYNYRDIAEEKIQVLHENNIDIISCSPTASGMLCHLNEYNDKLLKLLRPWETNASWAFSFLKEIKTIKTIISNVSSVGDVNDNNHIFNFNMKLQSSEINFLIDLGMKLHTLNT